MIFIEDCIQIVYDDCEFVRDVAKALWRRYWAWVLR